MGMYFNPDHDAFLQAVNSQIYIDKTGLLNITNQLLRTEKKCISLSHARRFGKSQVARMIDAYYSLGSDSKELFSKFEIAKSPDFEKHLNKYNVIHLDISSFTDYFNDNLVETIIQYVYDEFRDAFGKDINYDKTFGNVLYQVYQKTGIPFVIIIDEWDCVIRNLSDNKELLHDYMQFLHSIFKSEEAQSFLALAYITGILPIKKINDESALNNFREYTMLDSKNLTKYFGFTTDEVKVLCDKYDMDFEAVKEWYNGYLINGLHMYNPNSVYESMIDHRLDSYWKNTSAFATINTYITRNYHGLKEDVITMLSGGKVKVDVDTFQNDLSIIESKDEVLTALIHLGYLGYNEKRKSAYIPNFEVAKAYQSALKKTGWSKVETSIARCEDLLEATVEKDEQKVAELMELAHDAYTSILKYNDENSLSCCVMMAYFTAPAHYMVVRELPSGTGYVDIAFVPRQYSEDYPAMVIELKYDKSADSAIRQIKEKRYTGALKDYGEEILLVGINYNKDSKEKKHECKIEVWRNQSL